VCVCVCVCVRVCVYVCVCVCVYCRDMYNSLVFPKLEANGFQRSHLQLVRSARQFPPFPFISSY